MTYFLSIYAILALFINLSIFIPKKIKNFLKQDDIIADEPHRGSVWKKGGLNLGGISLEWPIAYQHKYFDVWDLGEGRDDRYHLKRGQNYSYTFSTLSDAIAFGEKYAIKYQYFNSLQYNHNLFL